jgi:O-antigen ligase
MAISDTGERSALFLFVLVTAMLIYSVEIPINIGFSQYASINSEDFAVLILFSWLTKRSIIDRESLAVPLKKLTLFLFLCSIWILFTFLIALLRSPEPVGASALWVLKWFEVIIFFVCVQHLMTKRTALAVVRTVILGGIIIGIYTVLASEFLTDWRVRVFFNNPNTLASFFTLLISLSFSRLISHINYKKWLYVLASLLGVAGIIATLSRSGTLAMIVVLCVLFVLYWRYFSAAELRLLIGGAVTTVAAMAVVLQDRITRFTEWFVITGEGIKLAGGQASRSFTKRLELIDKAIELFIQNPIFGYGWFASPSRVGFLDVLYTILIVELGLPGLILMISLYIVVIKTLLQARIGEARFLSGAILAWFLGLLAMGIGGSYVRSPQMMMLWTLMVVTAWKVAHGNDLDRGQSDLNEPREPSEAGF